MNEYMADDKIFKENSFVTHIFDHNRKVNYCGVDVHHQNAVEEREIRTISEIARYMLFHPSLHWKGEVNRNICPIAVTNSTYMYSHLPNENGIFPADLFTGTTAPR